MKKLEEKDDEQTPLQKKLESIANDIGVLGTVAAGLTVSVLFVRFFIEQNQVGFDWENQLGNYLKQWFSYLIVGITIIVVAVPEGLPLAVIISLAYSVRKMLEEKNFVKKLSACEIMGGANNICSDKTGTLTKNEMTVVNIWQGKTIKLKVADKKYLMGDYIQNAQSAELFLQACTCNTLGNIQDTNATDKSILQMVEKFGYKLFDYREKYLPEGFTRFQFTSRRKKMSTILEGVKETSSGYPK